MPAPDATEAPAVVGPALLRALPLPAPGEDKNDNGRVLVIGGSRRSPGALRLSGEAVLRVGAGRVTLATVDNVIDALAVAVPEAGMIPLPSDTDGAIDLGMLQAADAEAERADVVLLGPGLVDADHATDLVARMLPEVQGVVVLDGLATYHLHDHPEALEAAEGRCVVTANPKELARLLGVEIEVVLDDPLTAARDAARRCNTVIVCGGTAKHVVAPDGAAWVVEGGGPGLAASGSGDVHAGILAGLLARGAPPPEAAIWAGHLHARAGERLAAEIGSVGYLARELPAQVPAVLRELG